jgi:hypothetical protein
MPPTSAGRCASAAAVLMTLTRLRSALPPSGDQDLLHEDPAGAGYSSPEKRCQAAWRVMPIAAPILAQVMPRARALLTRRAT